MSIYKLDTSRTIHNRTCPPITYPAIYLITHGQALLVIFSSWCNMTSSTSRMFKKKIIANITNNCPFNFISNIFQHFWVLLYAYLLFKSPNQMLSTTSSILVLINMYKQTSVHFNIIRYTTAQRRIGIF